MSFKNLLKGQQERLQEREIEEERELKRRRTMAAQQQAGTPFLDTIYVKLMEIQQFLRECMDDETLQTIEIEVRLGMIVLNENRRWKSRASKKVVAVANQQTNFKAGIDQVFAHKLKKKLGDKRFFAVEQKPLQVNDVTTVV